MGIHLLSATGGPVSRQEPLDATIQTIQASDNNLITKLQKRFYKLRSGQPKNRCSIPGKGKIFVYTRSVRTGSANNNSPGWGEVKASISSSDKLKIEWIYISTPPWTYKPCIGTSLLFTHTTMAPCEHRAASPSSCTKRSEYSDSLSAFSTHVEYLGSATYKEITYTGQSEPVRSPSIKPFYASLTLGTD